jgi:hypothetical protein
MERGEIYEDPLNSFLQRQRWGEVSGGGSQLAAVGADRPFGATEGLAVYLNGPDLPDTTYRDCDANVVYDEFNRLLEGSGRVHSR